jgi:transposase
LAAKRVLAGDGVSTPRAAGTHAALRVVLVAYRSCVEERTRRLNLLQGLHVTAPAALRERVGRGNGAGLADRLARMRDRPDARLHEQTMLSILRDLARRARQLDARASQFRRQITALVRELHPTLMNEPGVGPISAAKLLVLDPARSETRPPSRVAMAPAPQPASSGQTIHHRLSRGGDRQANNAIHAIAMNRTMNHAEIASLPRAQNHSRQDPTRSHARTQTTDLTAHLSAPHRTHLTP